MVLTLSLAARNKLALSFALAATQGDCFTSERSLLSTSGATSGIVVTWTGDAAFFLLARRVVVQCWLVGADHSC